MNSISLSPDLPIIVGVSGGADSLCLLGKLDEAGYPLIVAHFDHQLRPDSGEGAKFVEGIASQFDLPFLSESDNVSAYAKKHKETIEEAARNLRYRFLFAQARKHGAQAVAVGHTADDQVETVLMHFLRGAGLSGLKGMEARAILPAFDAEIPIVRPILDLWRDDTVAYCLAHDLHPHEDPSNASDDFFRNRLRHNLIPELEKYNPRFRETLQRTSRALSGDHSLLSELIEPTWQNILLEEKKGFVSFDLPAFAKLSPALIRNLIKTALERLRPGQIDISFATLDRAAKFMTESDRAQRIDLASGLLLLREADRLYLADGEENLPTDFWPQIHVIANPERSLGGILAPAMTSAGEQSPSSGKGIASSQDEAPRNDVEIFLTLPCEFDLGKGWVLIGRVSDTAPILKNDDPFQVTLDADTLGKNLILRLRRSGERFHPLGMNGKSMKLSDFFINAKLPRRLRDRYPLLCTEDEIVWIPGYRPAHRFRITESTKRVVAFSLRKR
ncbi:MAG: tRNA lysidine(34) synthetase TilS [Anaerolineales bacterium]|uniref:tRNA(Ile)-lysidine synthase n=1 Tax=Candidatus Desulfolinea nitratireducens TaxID=2841698 RepID=A0A8J6THE3_9CHLR|nr:tRNA lysidine(34) synthetase TilS [Candidatus Desulfolinea nitratireducens]MBL6962176.1 tRNA lysidine(34) synthetase TilS [Anaerolineales bacterium]